LIYAFTNSALRTELDFLTVIIPIVIPAITRKTIPLSIGSVVLFTGWVGNIGIMGITGITGITGTTGLTGTIGGKMLQAFALPGINVLSTKSAAARIKIRDFIF